jgi:hemerythrin superfamily protein
MTQTSTRAKGHTSSRSAAAKAAGAAKTDAISLLKADHRQVADWFEQFQKSRSSEKKSKLAQQICEALTVHTKIEEEIFYPAFLEATGNKDIHHEAEIEHEGAKNLIAQIEDSTPADEYFDSKVKVLSEMIKHHVKEEEKSDGMFAEARDADMDLDELGAQMKARKDELMGEEAGEGDDSEVSLNG